MRQADVCGTGQKALRPTGTRVEHDPELADRLDRMVHLLPGSPAATTRLLRIPAQSRIGAAKTSQ